MSANANETIADIVACMRSGEFDAVNAIRTENYKEIKSLLDGYADRIEASRKREYDTLNSEREKCRLYGLHEHEKVLRLMAQLKAVGNMAAMREALESVQNWCINKLGGASVQVTIEGLLEIVNRALSAPPRNCDVVTADEQIDRMLSFCWRKGKCTKCEHNKIGTMFRQCTLRWAQMPYESEAKNDEGNDGE